jgi:hypothetical protein
MSGRVPPDDDPPRPAARSQRVGSILLLLAVVLVFAVDFHLDVRDRDAFSWMDPYQYFDFAYDVVRGRRSVVEFEVPSVFPLLLIPILSLDDSIPSALWINIVSLLALLAAIHALVRELGVRSSPAFVAIWLVSSPLLLGLSRSLYVELTSTALVAWALLLWLRVLRRGERRDALLFSGLMFVGTMTKTTFALFLLPLIAAATVERMIARRPRDAMWLLGTGVVPLVGVVLVQATVFSRSFGYLLSAGNTALPIAYLIGPHEALSWEGATYYIVEIARSLLFLLTPFLLLAAFGDWRRHDVCRWATLRSPRTMLWIQLVAPALLFVVPPVKEPRHLLPALVPAVLLIALGIDAVRDPRWRGALQGATLALAGWQFVAVGAHWIHAPYFLDRPLRLDVLERTLLAAVPAERYASTPDDVRPLHWRYDQSLAVAGLPPSEALALAWWAFPGVVHDLDSAGEGPGRCTERGPERFEDLFVVSVFNIYNRRSGWRRCHDTLDAGRAVAHGDFLILGPGVEDDPAVRFPEHRLLATIPRRGGGLRVLQRSTGPRPHYRTVFAEQFLREHPGLPPAERAVIARSLVLTAVLRGERSEVQAVVRRFPVLRRRDMAERNIYWIGGYPALGAWAERRLRELDQGPPRGRD